MHLASLAALFLLVVAWRIHLEQYMLELRQPSAHGGRLFSGAGYVDVHIRLPGLGILTGLAIVLALACVAAPFVARAGLPVVVQLLLVGIPAALLAGSITLLGTLIPSLVQRYVVDPNPLASEQPYLGRSLAATKTGLALDAIDVVPYTPTGRFTAADFSPVREQLARRSDLGHLDPRGPDARARHRHALLQARGADASTSYGRTGGNSSRW